MSDEELESVRGSLMLLASIVALSQYDVSSVDILRRCGLSESVIDWATTPPARVQSPTDDTYEDSDPEC